MLSFPVPFADAERLQAELLARFSIEIPARRVEEQTLLRLSVQAYTTEDDCGRLVSALRTLAPP